MGKKWLKTVLSFFCPDLLVIVCVSALVTRICGWTLFCVFTPPAAPLIQEGLRPLMLFSRRRGGMVCSLRCATRLTHSAIKGASSGGLSTSNFGKFKCTKQSIVLREKTIQFPPPKPCQMIYNSPPKVSIATSLLVNSACSFACSFDKISQTFIWILIKLSKFHHWMYMVCTIDSFLKSTH